MAGSTYGTNFTITTWGESHGAAIGICRWLSGRSPPYEKKTYSPFWTAENRGRASCTTARKEADKARILSGDLLKAEQPELQFQFSSQTKISVPTITEISKTAIVRDTQIIPLIQNTVSAITGVEGALPEGKPSDASLPGLLLPRFLQSLAFTSKRTPAQLEISKSRLLNIIWKKYLKTLCICREMPMPPSRFLLRATHESVRFFRRNH